MDNQNQQPVTDPAGMPQVPVQPEPQVPVVEPVAPVSEPVTPPAGEPVVPPMPEPQAPATEPVVPVEQPVQDPNQGGQQPGGTL